MIYWVKSMENVKNKVNSGKQPSLSELTKRIMQYEYISFDIFDTLLKRNVNNPSDVFKLMDLVLNGHITDFEHKRIRAEQQARLKISGEITIKDIYNQMATFDENIDIDRLIDLELNIESKVLTGNELMIELFDFCKKSNKKVFIISDMYLPRDFIVDILSKNNITNYDKLYVSSEYKKSKNNGDLFDLYLSENHIIPDTAIHIGDSWHSDWKVPKSKGITALHIPKNIKHSRNVYDKNDSLAINYLSCFLENSFSSNDSYYNFGFRRFGPFLWGYTKWLYEQLRSNKINKVFFFSRDGFIMKKAFNLLYPNTKIDTHYLEVSRRSLRVPILWIDHSFNTMLGMVSPSKKVTLQSIFSCVGLNIDNYPNLLTKYNFNKDTYFDRNNIKQNEKLMALYNDLSEDIDRVSGAEYKYLKKYLIQENVNGKFGIVDIGWSGGMQRFLSEALDKLKINSNIKGYYIGVADYYIRNTKVLPSLDLKGYLFDFKNNSNSIDERSSFVGLFETLFLEQSGSVKNYSYSQDLGKIIANRYPYEYIVNGEKTTEQVNIESVQEGALDFIKKAQKDMFLTDVFSYSAEDLFKGLKETGQQPQKKDLQLFANFEFLDEGEKKRLAYPKPLSYYLLHLKSLKEDFLGSRWKTGFMKELFKIDFPYQKIYTWLLKYK